MTINNRRGEEGMADEQILNIKVDGSSTARIMVNIEGQDKIALIDTGAGRCCMNEEHYQTLGSPPLEPTDIGFHLQTASGALMPGMGFLTCNMQVGGEDYQQQFIICKQLTPGIILGSDFLSKNKLGITWGPEGVLQLRDNKEIQVQTTEEINTFSAQIATKITVPTRSLIVVPVTIVLPSGEIKTRFDFTPIQENTHLGPNCVVYPLDYASIKGATKKDFKC